MTFSPRLPFAAAVCAGFFLLAFLPACLDDDDSDNEPAFCGTPIVVADQTDAPASDNFTLVSHSTDGLCLTVTIGASGCSQEGWTLDLRTDGSVAESVPTQTNARLIFNDQVPGMGESCLAYFELTKTFDLSAYLTNGALPTVLSLTGPDEQQTQVPFE